MPNFLERLKNWTRFAVPRSPWTDIALYYGTPLIPVIVWTPIFLYWDIDFMKTFLAIAFSLVGGFVGIRLKITTEVFEQQKSPPSTNPIIIITTVVIPLFLLLWGLAVIKLDSSSTETDVPKAVGRAHVTASVPVHLVADLKKGLTVKGLDWLPDNKVEAVFTLNQKTGSYEPEKVFAAIVPPELKYFEYDISTRPPGYSLDIISESKSPQGTYVYSYQTGNWFLSHEMEVHYFHLKWQGFSSKLEEVKISIGSKPNQADTSGRKLSYLLGQGYVKNHDAIIMDVPKDLGLRDVCLAPSSLLGDMAAFTGLSIPAEGFRITMDPKFDLKKLANNVWPKEMIKTAPDQREAIQERAVQILQVEGLAPPLKDIPWMGLYYRIGDGAPQLLSKPVALTGSEVAGKTIRIGLNTHGIPKGKVDPIPVTSFATIYVAVTSF